MKLLSLTCCHCGAPLEVPDGTKFVTCAYCSSRLQVHHSGGAVYTQVLEALQQQTERIADDVETLKLQNELDRVDREWMLERERYMVRGKHGGKHVPSRAGAFMMLAFVLSAAVLWMAIAGGAGGGAAVVLFGLFFIVFGAIAFSVMLSKADQHERRQRAYQRRRQAILRDIDSRGSAGG